MGEMWAAAALLKAAGRRAEEAEGEQPEAWMAPLESGIALAGGEARAALARDAPRLFLDLVKAAGGLPVTQGQLAELKLLVRQHYLARLSPAGRAAFWAIPEATRARWRRLGILGPADGVAVSEQIDDAVVAARVAEILDQGTSYATMKDLAAQRPQTRVQELAAQIAREHAGRAIDWLADQHGHALTEVAAAFQLGQLRTIVSRFLGGQLRDVRGEGQLGRHLRATLGGGRFDRDWQRIAVAETRWAFNYATLVHYQEQDRERIYFHVQPDACDHCKRLLLGPGGAPRVFALGDILENIALTGGTNAGRSPSLIGRPGGWLPTALIHPWCRCRPLPYLPGLPPAPVGDLRPPHGRR